MPLPRSSIINASSSGDHLDCFLAGDSAAWPEWRRLAGTELDVLTGKGVTVGTGFGAGTDIAGAMGAGGSGFGGRVDAEVTGAVSSSS